MAKEKKKRKDDCNHINVTKLHAMLIGTKQKEQQRGILSNV